MTICKKNLLFLSLLLVVPVGQTQPISDSTTQKMLLWGTVGALVSIPVGLGVYAALRYAKTASRTDRQVIEEANEALGTTMSRYNSMVALLNKKTAQKLESDKVAVERDMLKDAMKSTLNMRYPLIEYVKNIVAAKKELNQHALWIEARVKNLYKKPVTDEKLKADCEAQWKAIRAAIDSLSAIQDTIAHSTSYYDEMMLQKIQSNLGFTARSL